MLPMIHMIAILAVISGFLGVFFWLGRVSGRLYEAEVWRAAAAKEELLYRGPDVFRVLPAADYVRAVTRAQPNTIVKVERLEVDSRLSRPYPAALETPPTRK